MSSSAVRAIATDPDAFEAFYREHLELVRRFVARRTDDPDTAADLTADVFVAAIDSAHGYREERGSPAAWLTGVARNVVAAEARRKARLQRTIRRLAGRPPLDADSLLRLEERLDAERETRRLYQAITTLPPRERELLELVAIDGLSVAEAATELRIRPGTARVRLHRARVRLGITPQAETTTLSTEANR